MVEARVLVLTLVVALFGAGLIGYVGYLGHTVHDVRTATAPPPSLVPRPGKLTTHVSPSSKLSKPRRFRTSIPLTLSWATVRARARLCGHDRASSARWDAPISPSAARARAVPCLTSRSRPLTRATRVSTRPACRRLCSCPAARATWCPVHAAPRSCRRRASARASSARIRWMSSSTVWCRPTDACSPPCARP